MQESTTPRRRWLPSDEAATAIEYSIVAAAIALAIIVAVTQIGTSLEVYYADVESGF